MHSDTWERGCGAQAGVRSKSGVRQRVTVGACATVPNLVHVDEAVVAGLMQRLDSRRPEHVTSVLGISINTLVKLERGLPIRASLAARLLERCERGTTIGTDATQVSRRRGAEA